MSKPRKIDSNIECPIDNFLYIIVEILEPIFFKFSPLIDTSKYMLGKIDEDYNLLELPKFINDEISKEYLERYHKILDCNNLQLQITYL
mgnify:CR=1 FL=1